MNLPVWSPCRLRDTSDRETDEYEDENAYDDEYEYE